MDNQLPLDFQLLKKSLLVLRALKNKKRLKILKLIHQKKRITVTEIYTALKIEQSVASQQLAILRLEDFVHAKREGKQIYYSINYSRLDKVNERIVQLLEE